MTRYKKLRLLARIKNAPKETVYFIFLLLIFLFCILCEIIYYICYPIKRLFRIKSDPSHWWNGYDPRWYRDEKGRWKYRKDKK